MWKANVVYEDANNFLSDKALFSGAIQSVIDYLGTFIEGIGNINIQVSVGQTPTGRFAGGGAVAAAFTENGLNYTMPEVAKELTAGVNFNGDTPDLTIFVDPSGSYFKSLSFDTNAYTAPRAVPAGTTDGQTVILHELMHGLGISSYRDPVTGQFSSSYRSAWDYHVKQSGSLDLLDMPSLAAHGLAPLQVTSDSVSQNYSHLANNGNHGEGYMDDLMNGLVFYHGQRYYMSQIDLMILEDLGYKVNIPDSLPLSYYAQTGKALTLPSVIDGAAGAFSSNLLHLSGTAAAGAMTSVLEHGNVLGTTTADANGHWTLDVATDPSLAASALVVRDGTHAVDSPLVAISRDPSVGMHLYGSALYTELSGGSHNDLFTSAARGVSIDGGAGRDTVEYNETFGANSILKQGDAYVIKSAAGTDTLTDIERVRFSDGMVALDVGANGIAGQAYRLYQAAFNRAPDKSGLGFWIKQMDDGLSLKQSAQFFLDSTEAQSLYGANPSDEQLVTAMYSNVLHRAPDAEGFSFWTEHLAHGLARADMLAYFSESTENMDAMVGIIGNGFTYTPA